MGLQWRYELPRRLWCLLHRAVHIKPAAGDAPGQASGAGMCEPASNYPALHYLGHRRLPLGLSQFPGTF